MNSHESLIKGNYPCNYAATLRVTFILKVNLQLWFRVAVPATLVTIVLPQRSI